MREPIKLYVDDVRETPEGFVRAYSVNEAISIIEAHDYNVALIDTDHDAGDFQPDGGDYIHLLDWLVFKGLNIPIKIHSSNGVGVDNMRRIIERNGWTEVA